MKDMKHEIPFDKPGRFQALTGVSIDIFNKLLAAFCDAKKQALNEAYDDRLKRCPSFTRRVPDKHHRRILSTPEEELYFILYYYKNYPTQEAMADKFHMSLSAANRNIHKYSNILNRALSILKVSPVREISSPEEFNQLIENNEIFIDVTERSINRPSDHETQKNNFSGKQHRHTNKNLVISTENRSIVYLGPTTPGTHHDYRMLKDEFPPEKNILQEKIINVDLGFTGIKNDYETKETKIPHKKPKKSKKNPNPTLTHHQKKENRRLSKKRIIIEHAIGGMKILNILKYKFRNWAKGFIDEVIEVASGLWNLKLSI